MNRAVLTLLSVPVLLAIVPAISHAAVPVISSIGSPTAGANGVITITGSGFDAGATVTFAGAALAVQSMTATQVIATGALTAPPGSIAAVQVSNPSGARSNIYGVTVSNPGALMSYGAAKRFLEQATWGPTPASIAHLQSVGINAWLNEQFDTSKTPISQYATSEPPNTGLQPLQAQFFHNALTGSDQLRQRVAFALGQIAVVSGYKLFTYDQISGFEQMLLTDAFGPYGNFLKDVTLSASMGLYLDMVNNDISYVSTPPNANYARELMQLFSIGTQQLNADGTLATGGNATYSEADVKALAKVFTGWTYPRCDGGASTWPNPQCFIAPMIPNEGHHDNSAKVFLGTTIQTGSAEGDLAAALTAIQSYRAPGETTPNIAPFVSLRLIQHLVKSNPTAAYVGRVAAAYVSNGGSLQQVVRAILTDTEARAADDGSTPDPNDGHFREPVFVGISLLRALNATVSANAPIADVGGMMGQELFYPPTVFNFYSAEYQVPQNGLVAPELQTLNSSTAFVRANYMLLILFNALSTSDFHVDLSNFAALGSDTNPTTQTASLVTMLNAVSRTLLGSNMAPEMINAILPALTATPDPQMRAITATYLTAVSGRYQVQH